MGKRTRILRGKPGPAGRIGGLANVVAFMRRFGSGAAEGTFSFVLGGTATLTVTLDRTFPGEFTAMASISKQTLALLGVGVVAIKEVRPLGANQVEVVVTSSSILSNVTVKVTAWGMGIV